MKVVINLSIFSHFTAIIIGVSVGAVVSVVMLILIVIGIPFSIWCYKKNHQKTKFNIKKGSTVSGTVV